MAKATSKNGHAKPKAEEPLTAYFLSLEVENVRCFGEKQKLDLSDGNGKPAPWTIILGVNGTGKTTLLQCLVIFEFSKQKRTTTTNDEESVDHGIFKFVSHRSTYPTTNELIRRHPTDFVATVLSAKYMACTNIIAENFQLRSLSYTITHKIGQPYDTGSINFGITGDMEFFEPPVTFSYGAGRRIGEIAFLEESVDDDPTGTLFSDKAKLRNPEEWLIYLDYTSSTEHMVPRDRVLQRKRRDIAVHLLKEVLWEIDGIRFVPGEGMRPKPRVEFLTKFGWVPFRQLGYGYQSLATWVADFASRMVERYPYSENPLAEPAVVLVDEIDLHLHPKWQRELMGRLTKLFPNTQFIATAHSPLIAQAAAAANLAVLRRDGDQVLIDNDVDYIRNWRVDQILTSDLFGLETARSPAIEGMILERQNLLGQSKLTAANKKRVKQLDVDIGYLQTGNTPEEMNERAEMREILDRLSKERQPTQ